MARVPLKHRPKPARVVKLSRLKRRPSKVKVKVSAPGGVMDFEAQDVAQMADLRARPH